MPKNKPTGDLTMGMFDVSFQNSWGEFIVITTHGVSESAAIENARVSLPQPWEWEFMEIVPAQ